MVAPGILFLLDVARILAPPLGVHASLVLVLRWVFAWKVSVALVGFGWLFTFPVYIQARSAYTHIVHVRSARRLGARLVPSLKGKLPGNIDMLYNSFTRKKGLYLGDGPTAWAKEHGTSFALTTLGETRIITMNPENLKRILVLDFDNYVKGKTFNTTMENVLGVGVFNSDGDMWQFHRKITRPFFAKERVTDFGIFEKKSHLAIDRMLNRFKGGDAIDFQDICSRFTLDSACEFLLGTSVNSLDAPLPTSSGQESEEIMSNASNRFSKAFANAQVTVSGRGRLGIFWRLKEFFKDKTEDDMVVIKGFIDPIVKAAMDRRKEDNENEKDESLLEHLLNVTDDLKIIVDEVLNIMLAGRDTTASLLTFVVYCMAMHPEVLIRLREEVISTNGNDCAPTLDDLRGMKYLRAVINETLRLYSPVPFNVRQTLDATTWVDDEGNKLYIPPKTRVAFSYLNMHRHEAYWGPDAHLFDPDRWLDERLKKYIIPNPFVFLPFNGGPRICLGQQFAYHEASFFIVRLLQRFTAVELAPYSQPLWSKPPAEWIEEPGSPRKKLEKCYPKAHLTLFIVGGLWLRMTESTKEVV